MRLWEVCQVSLRDWCEKNGYDGITKECVNSAFNSPDPKVQEQAKREKLKQMIEGRNVKEEKRR